MLIKEQSISGQSYEGSLRPLMLRGIYSLPIGMGRSGGRDQVTYFVLYAGKHFTIL